MARIGFLGGTFDPIHWGHLLLAEYAQDEMNLDSILFVPAGNPWRKSNRQISEAGQRLTMLKLALTGLKGYEVETLELEYAGPSYTVDTLRELRRRRSRGDEWYLLLGEDALGDLPQWHEPEAILELARPVVGRRPGSLRATIEALEATLPGIAERVRWLDMPLIDISSTYIRERVRQGRSIRFLVPPAVEEYIRRERLYLGTTEDR